MTSLRLTLLLLLAALGMLAAVLTAPRCHPGDKALYLGRVVLMVGCPAAGASR